MTSELKWSLGVCGFATMLAGVLVQLFLDLPVDSLLGWVAFIALLQLPILANAARGKLDPCTSWFRNHLGPGRAV